MEKISKILVPIDFSTTAIQAFHYAVTLAGTLDAALYLLHVIYPQMENIDQPTMSSDRATLAKKHIAEQKMQELLETAKKDLDKIGKTLPLTAAYVALGGTIAVIKAQVKEKGYNLIVMGTRGEHDSVENLLGTVASDVVGNAACPVIVVPEYAKGAAISKIAHALDTVWMRPKDLLTTVHCFQAFHREVHLVRFGEPEDQSVMGKLLQLKGLLEEQLSGIPIAIHSLRKQELAEGMNEFVRREGIDLLIMYRSPSGFFRKLFHRSRSREMARKTRIPLLVV